MYISSVLKLPKDEKVYVIGMDGIEQELAEEGVAFEGGTVRFWPFLRRHSLIFPRILQIIH